MQVPEATRLPIKAESSDGFFSTAIYAVPDQPGLYRRVSRNGRVGLKTEGGHVLAIVSSGDSQSLCELKRWIDVEVGLRQLLPGVESPNPDQEGKPF